MKTDNEAEVYAYELLLSRLKNIKELMSQPGNDPIKVVESYQFAANAHRVLTMRRHDEEHDTPGATDDIEQHIKTFTEAIKADGVVVLTVTAKADSVHQNMLAYSRENTPVHQGVVALRQYVIDNSEALGRATNEAIAQDIHPRINKETVH